MIGTVVAVDADDDPLRYFIDTGTINANNFDVNETTGEVSFERPLDREVRIPDSLADSDQVHASNDCT